MVNQHNLLKIISYNIHSGKNFWLVPTFRPLIRFLADQDADIITIQEINENNKRGYQFTALQNALKLTGRFAPHVPIGNGNYGLATFSRFPILSTSHLFLPSQKEQRGLLDTVIQVNERKVHILNTHLGLSYVERIQQLQRITEYIQALTSPFLLMGDFNTPSLSLDRFGCFDAALTMKKGHLPTMPFSKQRIDYIFHSANIRVIDYDVFKINLSDHYPISVQVQII
ncbi:endonuclease/exonuclease/phosphatase family protein [Tepidibacillus sp. LV47]|uniref:endonuclease/exonuclease/phosphatase family protein n=1 Tax=Tepidibacillus sp. LV47 TaxID=3398228 RepID=UPI003AAE1E93